MLYILICKQTLQRQSSEHKRTPHEEHVAYTQYDYSLSQVLAIWSDFKWFWYVNSMSMEI